MGNPGHDGYGDWNIVIYLPILYLHHIYIPQHTCKQCTILISRQLRTALCIACVHRACVRVCAGSEAPNYGTCHMVRMEHDCIQDIERNRVSEPLLYLLDLRPLEFKLLHLF
jgi:hypothetical protein